MATIRPNLNPYQPVPNSSFYSPETSYLCGPYYPAATTSSCGITINNQTGQVEIVGGGGGGSGVSSLSAGPGIALSASTGNVRICTNLVAGSNISIIPSGNQLLISSLAPGSGTVTAITAGSGLTGGTISTSGTIALNSNCVIPPSAFNTRGNLLAGTGVGTYTALTPGSNGQVLISCTATASGLCWATAGTVTSVSGTSPISVANGATAPVVSIALASTSAAGAVQLNNTLTSNSTTQALTAAQGKLLQDQVNSLAVSGGIQLAGTIDASTGLVASVTSAGTTDGYVVGSVLPTASALTNNSYVIVTTPGTFIPPGGTSTAATRGDWFLVSETSPGIYEWTYLNVGFDAPAATTTTPGVVELATVAETQAGTDGTLAVTPLSLASSYIPRSALTAKGALISASAASTPSALSVGSDGQLLVACAAAPSGLCWTSLPPTVVPTACITNKGTLVTGTAPGAATALPVGPDGQVLVACSAAPSGLCWASAPGSGIPCSCIVGKGGIITGTAGSAPVGLPVGPNGYILTANSTCSTGLEWKLISNSGTTPPASPSTGQLWYNTTQTPPALQVWNGTSWVPVNSTASTAAPTLPAVGQTWVDTSATPVIQYVWDGTNWVPTSYTGTPTAPTAPLAGQTWTDTSSSPPTTYVYDGSNWVPSGIATGNTAPTSPVSGQVWTDTGATPPVLYVYDGTSWVPASSSISATPPASPTEGQTWVDTSANPTTTKVWTGTAWAPTSYTASDTPPASPLEGQTWVNTFVNPPVEYIYTGAGWVPTSSTASTSAPTTPVLGQTWVDTSETPYLQYVWTGSAWMPMTSSTGATAPASPAEGQIWVDTSGADPVQRIWNGTDWVPTGYTGSTSAPASPEIGQTWVNTSVNPPVEYIYSSTGWVPTSSTANTTAPTSPILGQEWVDTSVSPPIEKIWDGTAWVPSGSTTSNTAPATPSVGQLWYNTSVSPPVLNVWDGTTWSSVAVGGSVSSVNTGTGLTGGPITSTGIISLANTTVTPGNYSYASLTVDQQGRLTAASSGSSPITSVTGTSPVSVTSGTTPVVSISSASTTTAGAVQLYNNTDSTSTALALTAAQGKVLQDQINSLSSAGTIEIAGTVDASTGLVLTVTSVGTTDGYVVGSPLPSPSATTNNTYVIVTTPGTFSPPGGGPTAATRGDWFLVSETSPATYEWTFLNVGFDSPYATTTVAGIVCLATDALAQAGVDNTTALTPASGASAFIPRTCVTGKGIILTGTNTLTPAALPVGTNGQILVACSTAATGLCWTNSPTAGIPCSCLVSKGSLITTASSSIPTALPLGTDGQILYVNNACATGLQWGVAPVTRCNFNARGDLLVGTGSSTFGIQGLGLDGQILTACSSSATGVCWTSVPAAAIPCACITGKGAIVSGTAAGAVSTVTIGSDGQVLTACNACPSGLTWSSSTVNNATPLVAGKVFGCTLSTTLCNTSLGYNALLSNTTCGQNTAIGANALSATVSGVGNEAVGANAMRLFTTGGCNVSVGGWSLFNFLCGVGNVVVGHRAMNDHVCGCSSTAIGGWALWAALGCGNTALGYYAGTNIVNGCCNVVIGPNTCVPDGSASNQLAIGTGAGNWITGDAVRNIQLGAGLRDCTGSLGTAGQALVSTGTRIQWATPIIPEATPTSAGRILGCTMCGSVALGCNAMLTPGTNLNNVAVGVSSMCSNTTGYKNTAAGSCSLISNTTGYENTAIGDSAARANTTGSGNTAIGTDALGCNVTGINNVAVGRAAAFKTIGDGNVAAGQCAMFDNTTGGRNVALGEYALAANIASLYSTAVGWSALRCSTGCSNVAIGALAGKNITTGNDNVVIGSNVTVPVPTGCGQLAIGYNEGLCWLTGCSDCSIRPAGGVRDCDSSLGTAGQVLTSTGGRIKWGPGGLLATPTVAGVVFGCVNNGSGSVGFNALKSLTTGQYNAALAENAGCSITTGSNNVAIGPNALCSVTTSSDSIAIGANALAANTTGTNNVAIGCSAARCNTIGLNNVVLGNSAFCSNTVGNGNVAVGTGALSSALDASRSVAVGESALTSATTGTYNTAIGWSALNNATGVNGSNVAIGALAGNNITTGGNNVSIGPNVTVAYGDQFNQLAIGYNTGCCWLTGDGTRAIKPERGIRDCNGNLGTAGQALTSTGGNYVVWANPSGSSNYVQQLAGVTTVSPGQLNGIAGVTITTTGGPVQLAMYGNACASGSGTYCILGCYYFRRCGGPNFRASWFEATCGQVNAALAMTYIDAPPAGTHCYELMVCVSTFAAGSVTFGEAGGPVLNAVAL